MHTEVKLDMKSHGALITVAMLSAYLVEEKCDYISLLVPFVQASLPLRKGERVNKDNILKKLRCEYSFEEFPVHLLNKILNKLCKNKHLSKKDGEYIVEIPYDSKSFSERKKSINAEINEVLNGFEDYLKENTTLKKISKDTVQKMLLAFFEQYGISVCVKEIEELNLLTSKNDANNFQVARFIIAEYEKKSEIFNHIVDIVKGYFVFKSIYFFSAEHKKDLISKLKDTEIYFDTRLLINALGLYTNEHERATNELIKLIEKSGGHVKTFRHIVGEVEGILYKYAVDSSSHATMRLTNLELKGYKACDVLRLKDSLEIKLKEIGIEIKDSPSKNFRSTEDAEARGFFDIREFKKTLTDEYIIEPKEISIDNDVESIENISLLRGKNNRNGIEDCNAILVTHNEALIKVVKKFFDERFSRKEISFAIYESDLTALLWLRDFNENKDMPFFTLIENAYAACAPSEKLIETFIEEVELLLKEKKISEEEALMMRTESEVRNDLINITGNDASKVSEKTVLDVKEKFIQKITEDKDEVILGKEKIIEKQKFEMDEKEKEIETYKQKENRLINTIKTNSQRIADKYEKKLFRCWNIIKTGYIVIVIELALISIVQESGNYFLAALINFIFAIVAGVNEIKGKHPIIKSLIHKLKIRKYNEIYAQKIEELELGVNTTIV